MKKHTSQQLPLHSWPSHIIVLVLFVFIPIFSLSTTILLGTVFIQPDQNDMEIVLPEEENMNLTESDLLQEGGSLDFFEDYDYNNMNIERISDLNSIVRQGQHLLNLPDNIRSMKPNELGEVMILMFHEIGEPEEEFRRTPDNFRRDLETLYQEGYRPVNLNNFLEGNIDIPLLTTPVILTFDDATPGHLRFIEENGDLIVDPDCAVGILEEFNRKYDDFDLAATFYVYFEMPFRQANYIEEKFIYLHEKGFEIGNHTLDHANLSRLSPEMVQRQLALPVKETQKYLPGYNLNTMALPYGIFPMQRELAEKGSFDGISYLHQAVLLAGASPAPSPFSQKFGINLPRIKASEIRTDNMGFQDWLEYFREKPERRYLSDGLTHTITFPVELMDELNEDAVGNRVVLTY